jgi:hypothetical protein
VLHCTGRGGSLKVDDYLRVPGHKGRLFAIGDCAGHKDGPLPPIAVAAEQQGIYLGSCFNIHYSNFNDQTEVRHLCSDSRRPLSLPCLLSPVGVYSSCYHNTNLLSVRLVLHVPKRAACCFCFPFFLKAFAGFLKVPKRFCAVFLLPPLRSNSRDNHGSIADERLHPIDQRAKGDHLAAPFFPKRFRVSTVDTSNPLVTSNPWSLLTPCL